MIKVFYRVMVRGVTYSSASFAAIGPSVYIARGNSILSSEEEELGAM
ncbi:MAG: hypothetical protein J7L91_00200 [Candidatus Korarchaeota archaeon]|nr:hypothetical protein [Candidatus Korarchaeota archaeon]